MEIGYDVLVGLMGFSALSGSGFLFLLWRSGLWKLSVAGTSQSQMVIPPQIPSGFMLSTVAQTLQLFATSKVLMHSLTPGFSASPEGCIDLT